MAIDKYDTGTLSVLEAIEQAINTGKGKQLTADGAELLDPRPVAPPVGYKRQPSMVEHIRNMVRSEQLRAAAEAEGVETFEEAEDFDVGDDYDPRTPYEAVFDPPPEPDKADPAPEPAPPPETAPKAPGTRPKGGETAPPEPDPKPAAGS